MTIVVLHLLLLVKILPDDTLAAGLDLSLVIDLIGKGEYCKEQTINICTAYLLVSFVLLINFDFFVGGTPTSV